VTASKTASGQEAMTKDQPVADALDTAWKIHAAQVDWTGKVDGKAVFAFGIQSAALGLIVTLSSSGRVLSQLHNAIGVAGYYLGIAALLLGATCALFVVKPRLRSRAVEAEAKDAYIYFGHLRQWTAENLASRLRNQNDLLGVLAAQCVTMAKISWRKHRLVQVSMISGAFGIGLLVLTGVYLAR
jgi:Pycsar effector protein